MMMMDCGQMFHWHRVYQQGGEPVKEFLKIYHWKICGMRFLCPVSFTESVSYPGEVYEYNRLSDEAR